MQAYVIPKSADWKGLRSLGLSLSRLFEDSRNCPILPDNSRLSLIDNGEGFPTFLCECGNYVRLSEAEALLHSSFEAGCGHPVCPFTDTAKCFWALPRTALPIQAGFIAFCAQWATPYSERPVNVRKALLDAALDATLPELGSNRIWVDSCHPEQRLHAGNLSLVAACFKHFDIATSTVVRAPDDYLGFEEIVQSFGVSPVKLLEALSFAATMTEIEKYILNPETSEIKTFTSESKVADLFRKVVAEAPAATSRHAQSRYNYNRIALEYNKLDIEAVLTTELLSKTTMSNIRRTLACRGLVAGDDYEIRRIAVNPDTGKAFPVGMRITAIMKMSSSEMKIIAC